MDWVLTLLWASVKQECYSLMSGLLWGLIDIQRGRCLTNYMACNHVFWRVSFNCKWQQSNSDHVDERWSWFGMAFTNQASFQGWVLWRASSQSWLIKSVFKGGGQGCAFSPSLSSTCLFLTSFNTEALHMDDMMATQSLGLTASQLTKEKEDFSSLIL